MTDKTKNFLNELADLLDKYEGGIFVAENTISHSIEVYCEKDNYTTIGRIYENNGYKSVTPQDIRKLIKD